MKSFPLWALFLLPFAASAETSPPAKPKAQEKSAWVFSLLPKSLQKNPNLDLTVITEMTEEGKKRPLVTSAHPAFYMIQSGGAHELGDPSGVKQSLPEAVVERLLTTALAANGYRPAELPAQPPTLAIFYTWGTHNLLVEGDPDNPTLAANQVTANLLDRARLVGGEKFARKMLELFHQADDLNSGFSAPSAPDSPAINATFLNPVALYKMQDPKNEFLVDQATDDIYYIVASAYDYQALTQKQRKLLWRTSMTGSAKGVSEEQTLPTVIASAAPFFGREMASAEILTRRPIREGQVDVGTPTVVESAADKFPEAKK